MTPDTVLVDTHAFLWFVFDDKRLSKRAARLLSNQKVNKVISIVSLWEVAVKVSVKKLELGMSYEDFIEHYVQSRDVEVLSIDLSHVVSYANLPFHHRDPFDRLLVAQALCEKIPVLTKDDRFRDYKVRSIW